jgi:Proline racemase
LPTPSSARATFGDKRASSAAVFEGQVRLDGDKLIPIIRGTAHITAEIELVIDETDPFCYGISA